MEEVCAAVTLLHLGLRISDFFNKTTTKNQLLHRRTSLCVLMGENWVY